MGEKFSREKKIIDLSPRQQAKKNEGRRTEIEWDSDGRILYPDEEIEISNSEALCIAQSIVTGYSTMEELCNAEMHWMAGTATMEHGQMVLDEKNKHASIPREPILKFLETQRAFFCSQHMTMDSLIRILQYHKKNPLHYSRVLIYAVAEVIIKRFSSATVQNSTEK